MIASDSAPHAGVASGDTVLRFQGGSCCAVDASASCPGLVHTCQAVPNGVNACQIPVHSGIQTSGSQLCLSPIRILISASLLDPVGEGGKLMMTTVSCRV